jgi:L-fucose isomerase-like protein
MDTTKTTFAVILGNRGFFPASLMDQAREELPRVLKALGHDCIMMDRDATRNGAVETPEEGRKCAKWLRENRGKFGGVILSLPNFGDENGGVAALKEVDLPILIHAYPDEMDKMAPELRRDSFCGKFSMMDVFYQNGIKFTTLKPHTAAPGSKAFEANIRYFDTVCRVVNGTRGMVVGAIGARTTAFKTVRFDEVALERHGITVETLDLSDVFDRMAGIPDAVCQAKRAALEASARWGKTPAAAQDKIIRAAAAIDQIVDEYNLDATAIRCWIEFQKQLGISPCIILGELNDRGSASACEVDVGNAVIMRLLNLATYSPATCLDWNNNFGDEDDKCILFHCGPVPRSLMREKGEVSDHAILANAVGEGCSYGPVQGRIKSGNVTFGSLMTDMGKPRVFLGEGSFTDDVIPADFFGCAGVLEAKGLQDVLIHVGRQGFRHHVSVAFGNVAAPMQEALEYYLGFEVSMPQVTA